MPGTGGSRDALAPNVTPGLYAILQQLRDGFAPYDPQEYLGSSLKPGESVYLSGIDGLPCFTGLAALPSVSEGRTEVAVPR